MPFLRVERLRQGKVWCEKRPGIQFCHVKFEIVLRYPSGGDASGAAYMSVEFKGQV